MSKQLHKYLIINKHSLGFRVLQLTKFSIFFFSNLESLTEFVLYFLHNDYYYSINIEVRLPDNGI